MDSGSKTCITHLPNEQLYLIFQKLDANLDRESFGLTCRLFLDIQDSSLKRLDLSNEPLKDDYSCPSIKIRSVALDSFEQSCARVKINSVTLDRFLNRFKQLESLSLSGCCDVFDSGLVLLQKYGSKLHSIHLDFCTGITEAGYSFIASGCPSLSFINLCDSSINDSGLEILAKSCKSLKQVDLGWCESVTDNGIRSLIQNCRRLRALTICHCEKVYGKGFEGCSPTLAYLEADYSTLIVGFNDLFSAGGLEYLNVAFHPKYMKGHGLAAIGSGVAANLKFLNFWKCDFVTDETVTSISKGCPLLQEWNLTYCKNVRISGWEAIGTHCQSLEMIHVGGCWRFCDRGLLALANGCKRLSVMYMKDCSQITPNGVRVFQMQRKDVKIEAEMVMSFSTKWAFTP